MKFQVSKKIVLGSLLGLSLHACRSSSGADNLEASSIKDVSPKNIASTAKDASSLLLMGNLSSLSPNLFEAYLGESSLDKNQDCVLLILKDKKGERIGMELGGLAKLTKLNDRDPDIQPSLSWVAVGERYIAEEANEENEKAWYDVALNFNEQPSLKYLGLTRIGFMSRKLRNVNPSNYKPEYPLVYTAVKILIPLLPKFESFIVANDDFSKAIGFAFGEGQILKNRLPVEDSKIYVRSAEITCENMKKMDDKK